MREFPKALYRCPGSLILDGVPCAMHIVKDAAEEGALLADGWALSVAAAADLAADLAAPVVASVPVPEPVSEVPPDGAPVTRAELEQRAKELGLKVDGRWSDARLLAEIDKAGK
jgi:hypothetical protein